MPLNSSTMGALRDIFGPSKDEIWSQIAAEIGGEYIDRGFWRSNKLRYSHGQWELLLDTYTVNSGHNNSSSTTYTRMRAPFVNKDGLYFKVHRQSLLSPLGQFFGMQDIQIGDPFFDDSFVIKGNSESKIKLLLADDSMRHLIHQQSRIRFEIRDDEGWFGAHFPDGVDELYFTRVGVMKDVGELKALFELFSYTLARLVQIDSAYEDDPKVVLK